MNGMTEPLPGLLDDPQFQFAELPALVDFHIAPLRNPAPSRHANVPSPLEPVAGNILHNSRTTKSSTRHDDDDSEKRRAPKITPTDVLLAREAKKPHLAISELLEDRDGPDIVPTQLPSFISLSVVERSPIQVASSLERGYSQKRLRLDTGGDAVAVGMIRHLPRPAQKDDRQNRPAPLLPAMVTGLHEPPPSAALLPSIDVESRPAMNRSTTTSKMHVKDMLTATDPDSALPPAPPSLHIEKQVMAVKEAVIRYPTPVKEISPVTPEPTPPILPWKDNKPRRARRKWTEHETNDLLAGVKRYGIGKWKQILDDPAFSFSERSSVDLKDRYRVCANNDSVSKLDTQTNTAAQILDQSTPVDGTDPSLSPTKAAEQDSPTDQNQPPKQRRKRRAWTIDEDESLLKGVGRHGFQWTAIHDDPELELSHRRATDLRDRIRNKFPDGYKHAETAPLRSEIKKAEKLSTPAVPNSINFGNIVTPPSSLTMTHHNGTPSLAPVKVSTPTPARVVNGKVKSSTSTSSLTMLLRNDDEDLETVKEKAEKEKDREKDQGVTLPSFTLEVDDDMDWEDNRLAPLHEWDEI